MSVRPVKRSERGAIMLLSALWLVVTMISCALAIDLGFIEQAARDNQRIADLATLDATRVLPANPTATAVASAARNGYTATIPTNFNVECATSSAGPFSAAVCAAGTGAAVRVTVDSSHTNLFPFVGTGQIVTRKAVGELQNRAGFSLGSSLANISTGEGTVLNAILGGMVQGNVSAVSWQGLLGGTLTLSALQTQLLADGFAVGSVDSLLNTDITLFELYKVSATVLTNNGQVAAANAMNVLKASVLNSLTMKLSGLFSSAAFSQGNPGNAMATSFNAFDFATGSAEVANGSNFITIPSLSIVVPNVTNTKVVLQVIEAPKMWFGAPAAVGSPGTPHVTTAQVQLTVTPTLNVPVANAGGLTNITVTGNMPLAVTGGGADGTLTAVTCSPKAITVGVDPKALTTSTNSAVTVNGKVVLVPVALATTVTNSLATDAPLGSLSFSYNAGPNTWTPPTAHYGGQTVGFANLATTAAVTINLGGVVGVNVALLAPAVATALNAALANVDSLIVTPMMQALGLSLGGGDVNPLSILNAGPACGILTLVS